MEFTEVVDHPDKPGQYLTPAELETYLKKKQEEQAERAAAAAAAAAAARSTDASTTFGTNAGDVCTVHPAAAASGLSPEGRIDEDVLTCSHPWLDDMIELGLGSETIHPGAVRVVAKSAGRAEELKALGNARYKAGDFFEAIRLYGRAICFCPLDDRHNHSRAVFHSNRAACHLALGRYEQCIDDCSVAIDLDSRYVRALMRRAKAYEKLERLEDAVEDLDAAVAVDSSYTPALQEQRRVKQLYHDKTEKMKEEMLGKLKGLGNTILGKFGMSLDNFKLTPQEGGGYSVSYEQ